MPSRLCLRAALLGALGFGSLLGAEARAAGDAPNDAPSPTNDRVAERARQLFDEGVRLANEGRFDTARAAFRGAYELQPHPSVLYNIAQCEVRLGDWANAAATLEHFLESSGANIPAEQREAVQKQLDELRAKTSPPDAGAAAPVLAPAAGAAAAPAPAAPPAPPPEPAPLATAPAVAAPAPAPLDAPAAAPARPERSWRPWLLGGTGLALIGTATALYVWNDNRHDAWSAEQDELESIPGFRMQVFLDPELWQRANASNQHLSSIHTVDALSVLLATVGTVALGAGVWDWLATDSAEPETAGSRLRLQGGRDMVLSWQGRW